MHRPPIAPLALLVVAISCVHAASTTTAHQSAHRQAVNSSGFGLGAAFPMGATADTNAIGWHVDAWSAGFPGRSMLGWRASLGYSEFTKKDDFRSGHSYGVDVDFALRFGSKTTFYLFAGPGYMWTTGDVLTGTPPITVVQHASDSSWSASAGFGVLFAKAFFFEARYTQVYTSPERYEFVPVTFGLHF